MVKKDDVISDYYKADEKWWERMKKTNEKQKNEKEEGGIYLDKSIKCPVCGESEIIEEWLVFLICGWEHDEIQQDDPEFEDGPNKLSLNQTKEWFRLKRQIDPNYSWINYCKLSFADKKPKS
jgi:hypothetical protein